MAGITGTGGSRIVGARLQEFRLQGRVWIMANRTRFTPYRIIRVGLFKGLFPIVVTTETEGGDGLRQDALFT